ncbi:MULTISPECIES: GntR family transcriptional regulator [Microbacterium]|uniref:GntR family transcriptional regulator n=1 Tax=Microbacterium TaxID=33882 RepID=UPI00278601AB|nr:MULTISPECIES: GntR family transcriptional regulator [Microbacterium]MDQ1082477.1 DNA-binding GntR family transcriptional regulator [Microbacterium sp. SORGH_AS_0344]MDQ1168752.1 DNA-binding GntR family transcriptional regulator [Microbacterium proteolyticum]
MTTTEDPLLAEQVYQRLQERVLNGHIPPGAALSVPRLAADLGVSRSPVREAVQQLIAMGLAVHVPYAGARVRALDEDLVDDVFELRESLDALAARRATTRVGAEVIDQLDALIDESRRAQERGAEAAEMASLDVRFHALLRDHAGSEPLAMALVRLEALGHLISADMWGKTQNSDPAIAEHEQIVAAVRRGDAQAAGELAAAHVRSLAVRRRRSAQINM